MTVITVNMKADFEEKIVLVANALFSSTMTLLIKYKLERE